MESKSGWRATPAPLVVAFATWMIFMVARVVIMNVSSLEREFSAKLHLTSEGIYFACTVMVMVGTLELIHRAAGKTRTMLRLALLGVALAFMVDTLVGFLQFTKSPWDHKWVYDVYSIVALGAWGAFATGMTMAAPQEKRVIGYIAMALTVFVWLPMPLADKVWRAFGDGKTGYTVQMLVRCVHLAMLGLAVVAASSGETTPAPTSAAEGFRSAARGLWLRVIAAVVVVLFTLMLITSRGEGMSFFKLLMMGQALIGMIALLITGLGALRAARSGIADLNPYVLAVGGGASLWATGVSLAQLPYVYKALYGSDGFGSMRDEYMTALSTALPIIVIVGVGLLSTALSGFGASRGDEELRTDAQGKGVGFVVLLLVGIAIQSWMIPKATSVGSFAMLSILGAIAGLWGTVMMAKLLGRGAEVLDQLPGLPPASVINSAPPPV